MFKMIKLFTVFSLILVVGLLVGVGCNNNLTNNSVSSCDSAKEIEAPNDLAKELKIIFNQAGGEIKLINSIQQESSVENTLVYVWKNKPEVEKLESAFENHGYETELLGEILIAKKGEIIISVSSTGDAECQEIIVSITDESIDLGKTVSTIECAELMAYAPKIDLRYNTLDVSYPWTLKYYARMAELEEKYGITQDELVTICNAKKSEPGFDDEVKRQEEKLQ